MILALDILSNCLINLKNLPVNKRDSPTTSAMPVQCSYHLSYEATQLRAGQFVGLIFPVKGMMNERSVL